MRRLLKNINLLFALLGPGWVSRPSCVGAIAESLVHEVKGSQGVVSDCLAHALVQLRSLWSLLVLGRAVVTLFTLLLLRG